MVYIFDTRGGLCNQMLDIKIALDFCIHYNLQFTFRNCNFRKNDDLKHFYLQPFGALFDKKFLNSYSNYIPFEQLNTNKENTYNFDSEIVTLFMINNSTDLFTQIKNFNKEHVVFYQFHGINQILKLNIPSISTRIYLPSDTIMNEYNKIKDELLKEPYNFIHYRYEEDFTSYFNLIPENLDTLISRVKNKFRTPTIKIYVATTNIKNLINNNDNIISKDEYSLNNYNFEQRAFIDFMIGLNSVQVTGHIKSSFSTLLVALSQGFFY